MKELSNLRQSLNNSSCHHFNRHLIIYPNIQHNDLSDKMIDNSSFSFNNLYSSSSPSNLFIDSNDLSKSNNFEDELSDIGNDDDFDSSHLFDIE